MKKIIITALTTIGLLTANFAYAAITVPQGGTGIGTVPAGYVLMGSTTNALQAVASTTIGGLPGGSSGQFQYNNGGTFGGTPYLTITGATTTVGNFLNVGTALDFTANASSPTGANSDIYKLTTPTTVGQTWSTTNYPLLMNWNASTTLLANTPNFFRKKIIVFGSSVAYGAGATGYNGWANQLGTLLTSRGWDFKNYSIAGNDTNALIARFYTDIAPEHPDYLIIGLGLGNEGLGQGNDEAVYTQYITNMHKIIQMCRQQGITPVIGGAYPVVGWTTVQYEYLKQFNKQMDSEGVAVLGFDGVLDDGTGQFITIVASTTAVMATTSTTATLSSAWNHNTGTYMMQFINTGNTNNEYHSGTLTDGSTAVTWTGGLASTTDTASFKVDLNYSDVLHPNDLGHTEMFSTIPPTMFDKLNGWIDDVKPSQGGGMHLGTNPGSTPPVKYIPSNSLRSFTTSFWLKIDHSDITGSSFWGMTGGSNNTRIRNPGGPGCPNSVINNVTGAACYSLILDASLGGTEITSTTTPQDGNWHNLTVTYNDTTRIISLYTDGALVGATTTLSMASSSFSFGSNWPNTSFSNGDIKDVLVYRTVLNPEQVKEIYSGKYPKQSLEIFSPMSDKSFAINNRLVNLAPSNDYLQVTNTYNGTNLPTNIGVIHSDIISDVVFASTSLITKGDIITSGLPPALTSCGTSPALVSGSSDLAGELVEGSASTGCTITFQRQKPVAPFCTVTSQAGLSFSYTNSATAITVTNIGALSSTRLNYMCVRNNI